MEAKKTSKSYSPEVRERACVDAPFLASMIFDLSAGSSIGRVSGL
jgi:hypothetical protein